MNVFSINFTFMQKKIQCPNRPFYSCVLSCLAIEWKWDWSWPCLDRNFPAVLMLISRNLHKKSSKVSIKTRSTPASLSFKGQATKHTTVKWSIQSTNIWRKYYPRKKSRKDRHPRKTSAGRRTTAIVDDKELQKRKASQRTLNTQTNTSWVVR